MDNSKGYIYAFCKKDVPDIFKIGMTKKTPIDILYESYNDNWSLDTYKLAIAKYVSDPNKKINSLHHLLTNNSKRINPHKEFFKISLENLKLYFDLIDGDIWYE